MNSIIKMAFKEEINIAGVLSNLYGENKADELTSAIHKRKITMYLNYLKQMHSNGTLTSSLCQKQLKAIEG